MLDIKKIDHVGIRVHEKQRAVAFYEQLGFKVMAEGVFEKGQPIIMEHPSGVVINLLGPANAGAGSNVLMDVEDKHAGYTHIALRAASLEETKAFLEERGIEITETMAFKDLRAVFVRDPDRNVIEFDHYPGAQPEARTQSGARSHDDR